MQIQKDFNAGKRSIIMEETLVVGTSAGTRTPGSSLVAIGSENGENKGNDGVRRNRRTLSEYDTIVSEYLVNY